MTDGTPHLYFAEGELEARGCELTRLRALAAGLIVEPHLELKVPIFYPVPRLQEELISGNMTPEEK